MTSVDTFRPEPGVLRARAEIPVRYKWDLTAICRTWDEWTASYRQLEAAIEAFSAIQGTLSTDPERLLAAYRAMD